METVIFGQKNVSSSPFFQLEEVRPGIYAAIASRGSGAMGNAGFVDLGDRLLVFDTFFSPQAARDLRKMAEDETGKPVSLVINSHCHVDHVLGNQAFEDAVIVATGRTRSLMEAQIPAFLEMAESNRNYPRLLEDKLKSETDPRKAEELKNDLGDVTHFVSQLDEIHFTPPHLTFEQRLTVTGKQRTAVLIDMGHGHTESDTILYLPDDGIVFTGDLLFHQTHPFLKYGDPDGWAKILDRILEMQAERFIPGHGPVASKEALKDNKWYLLELKTRVTQAKAAGKTLEEFLAEPIPSPYDTWIAPGTYEENVRKLYEL
jgi:cyclase